MFSTKNFGVGLGVPIIATSWNDHGGDIEYQSTGPEGTDRDPLVAALSRVPTVGD